VILPENAKAHYIKKKKDSLRLGSSGAAEGRVVIPLPKTKRNPLGRLHRSTNGRIRDTEEAARAAISISKIIGEMDQKPINVRNYYGTGRTVGA